MDWRHGCVAGFAGVLALALGGCSNSRDAQGEKVAATAAPLTPKGIFHGQLRQTKQEKVVAAPLSAPFGAHLDYFGGRVVSNVQVIQVLYGAGSYIPEVTNTGSPSLGSFYQGVLTSRYVDWLSEYNTTRDVEPRTNQVIGRGSFAGQFPITPSSINNGTLIDDSNIQNELNLQIQAGHLPAPTHDAVGNNNTYYAVFFPHGKQISIQGFFSCQQFCAYHGTIENAGGQGEVYYGVHPDFQSGSGCEFGCGAASTVFGNYTQVASHELVETMTDPEVGLAFSLGPPFAWFDTTFNEIGDICNNQNAQVVGGDGVTYDVQTEFSNTQNDCIATGPNSLIVDPNESVCSTSPASAKVTLLGGPTGFDGDVTLSVVSISPTPPPGGEITATFDPNPVRAPSAEGATATLQLQASAGTPSGAYTVTIQGDSPSVTTTAVTTLVVEAAVPGPPVLQTPPNASGSVTSTPTLTWSATGGAGVSYALEIYSGADCTGTPARSYQTNGTSFSVPESDALAQFQQYAWHVTAANVCGNSGSTSTCFHFATESCANGEVGSNGGFESDLNGWSADLQTPPPLVSSERPHSGANAVRLGTVTPGSEPLGDSAISQVVTLGSGADISLVFWMWGLSTDTIAFDQQYVRVTPLNPPGPPVLLLQEANNDRTYERRELSLAKFAGQTVQLTFGVHQDGAGDVTGMYVDDVSISSANCGPPAFALHVTAPAVDEVCAGSALAFAVSVESVHGPNFTSPVVLSALNLPPGATASFAKNPIAPGEATTLTLRTGRPTKGATYSFSVSGVAVTPPPDGPQTVAVSVVVDANAPNSPERISPRDGDLNLPRRPTLSFTAPFIPDALIRDRAASVGFLWQRAANAPLDAALRGVPAAFGAAQYHVQVASDAAFTHLVVDANTADTTFTVPVDLAIAHEYFWRVNATNLCGTSPYSSAGRFLVGACSEGWASAPDVPVTGGLSQSTLVAAGNGKLYAIGGGIGTFPDARIDQVWEFDPTTNAWSAKSSVPAPGVGSNFGSAASVGGRIYVFGGILGPPGPIVAHRALWIFDVASNTWSRGQDLPIENFGSAVAAINGKIYLAYGSGLGLQTWQYDPATDQYLRKADPLGVPQSTERFHGVALNGELHALAGGVSGSFHAIYAPLTDSWRAAPSIPFGVTDPAVGVLGGKIVVVGGQPVARMQVFDPARNAWSQGAPIPVPTGIENTAGTVLGSSFHLVGGFDGSTSVDTHWRLHVCNAGDLSSAAFLPFVVDGTGVAGVANERTALLLSNVSETPMSATCIFYRPDGTQDSALTISVAAKEVKTVPDVIRAVRGVSTAQNVAGSLAIFGSEVFEATASLLANDTGDASIEDGQPLSGRTTGFVPLIQSRDYKTQTTFSNLSSITALLQLVAYPAAGGDVPLAASLVTLRPHATVTYSDVASQLKLPRGASGQLSFSVNQPVAASARDRLPTKSFSGFLPIRGLSDASQAVLVPYVEDTKAFSTALLINNPGGSTANVTVRFADGPTGVVSSRDIPVPVNNATPIGDVVRWVLGTTGNSPSGKHGFVTVETPQAVTAEARLIDKSSGDPAVPDQMSALTTAFSPMVIQVSSFSTLQGSAELSSLAPPAATTSGATSSRFAASNPNSVSATVEIVPINASGSGASVPFVITLPPKQQYFTDNLAASIGLPPIFFGSVMVRSDSPVLIFNQRRTGASGATVPVHGL